MIPTPSTRFLVLLVSLGAFVSGFAQPASVGSGLELSTRYSHTTDSDVNGSGRPGSVQVDSWQMGLRATTPLSGTTHLVYGLDWTRHSLELSGSPGLPERLQAVAAPVGLMHRWDENWRLLATLQPRFAAAGTGLSSSGFDVPVLALASYVVNPELTWSFGLRYSARSNVPLLPLAGLAWKFAPGWELKFAWPDSGVSYQLTPQLTLRAVAAFHGGDYRLDQDPRAPADRTGPSLTDAWLEYREVRVGFAAEYAVGRTVSLRADLGKVVSQRFKYIDRDFNLEGETPTYFALSAIARF